MKHLLRRINTSWHFVRLIFRRGGDFEMAMVYVTLIIKGSKTIANVPETIRGQVADLLRELDCEHLAG